MGAADTVVNLFFDILHRHKLKLFAFQHFSFFPSQDQKGEIPQV